MGGKKPLRRPLWPPTRATASNYYPLGLDGAGGAAKPLLRAPKKPAPLHGRLPAFSGAVDAFERARKCFLEWRYFFSIILSEFLKNRVALHTELEALELTIKRFVSLEQLHEDLANYRPDLIAYYKSHEISFSNGDAIDLDNYTSDKLPKKIAARIYKTRNALVHHKSNTARLKERGIYHPFKDEAELSNEIPLMRFVAEAIIIKTATEI